MKRKFTRGLLVSLFSAIMPTAFALAGGAVDAGISSIIEPPSVTCDTSAQVKVLITNYGTVDINTVDVYVDVNGFTPLPVTYTGLITPGNSDTLVFGNVTFISGSLNFVTAYTDNPNGTLDNDNTNDASMSVVTVPMSGVFTIGGNNPNFVLFNDAIASLNTYGVCGPVIFNIRDGADTMQSIITPVTGVDATNTITFQGESGDSSLVVLTYPSQVTTGTNYLIRLNGADYITFRSITFERSGTQANARAIEFMGTATHNTIENCRFIGSASPTNNSLAALVYSSGGSPTNDSMNTFRNNYFLNGSIGIYMNGISSLSLEMDNIFTGNVFVDQYSKGIQLSNQGNITLSGNTISTISTNLAYTALYLDRCLRNHTITNNKLTNIAGTGIYMIDCTAFNALHGVIANNFIQCNDSAGISSINSDYQDFVYNSIHMTGTTASFTGLAMHGTGLNNIIQNNNIVNSGGGLTYVAESTAGISVSNYNNLYTTGAVLATFNGTSAADLAAWQTLSGKDAASVSVDPHFVSATDLHATAFAMDNLGFPYAAITTDIDGDLRHATTPDIGADEYIPIIRNVGITALVSPQDGFCGDSVTYVSVVVSNLGGSAESAFDIVAEITGADTSTQMQTVAMIIPGANDTITFATPLNTAAGGTYNITVYTLLAIDDDHSDDTLTTTITIAPMAPAPPVASDIFICGPGTVTFIVSSSPDTTYWFDAATGGNLVFVGDTFTTPVLNTSTTYYMQTGNYCSTQDRSAITAGIYPLPIVNLGNDTILSVAASLLLDAGPGFITYQWNTGDLTQTLLVDSTAEYSVIVTDANGCTNTDSINVTFTVGIAQTGIADAMEIYPNPANESFTFELNNLKANQFTYQLTDINGRIVNSEVITTTAASFKKPVDISNLPTGIYNFRLITDKGVAVHKLIVQ
jgi:parallel beta-helix repeat protein